MRGSRVESHQYCHLGILDTRGSRPSVVYFVSRSLDRRVSMGYFRQQESLQEINNMDLMERFNLQRVIDNIINGLYLLNWLFWITSILIMIIGLFHYWRLEVIQVLVDLNFNPEIYILGLSISLFFVGCLGYIALSKQNIQLLYWYLFTLLTLLIIYIPVGSVAFAISTDYKNEKGINEVWTILHDYNEVKEVSKALDDIQKTLQCCGLSDNGYKDWNSNIHFACIKTNFRAEKCGVPTSCCKRTMGRDPEPKCGASVLNNTFTQDEVEEKIYVTGCLVAITEIMERSDETLGSLAFGTSFVVLIGFVLTVFLIKMLDLIISKPLTMRNYLPGVRVDRLRDPLNNQNNRPIVTYAVNRPENVTFTF